jgi:hypothetical protein
VHGTPSKWVVIVREEVPIADFAAIIGDVIHNLRTALDHLPCELVRSNEQGDKDVYFPFAESGTKLDAMIKRRNMNRAKPMVASLIQAYDSE